MRTKFNILFWFYLMVFLSTCSAQSDFKEINYQLTTGASINKKQVNSLKSYIPYFEKELINGKTRKIEYCLNIPSAKNSDSAKRILKVFYFLDKNENMQKVIDQYKLCYSIENNTIPIIFCSKEKLGSFEMIAENYTNNNSGLNSTPSFFFKTIQDSIGRIISKYSNVYNPIYRKYREVRSKYLYNSDNKLFLRKYGETFEILDGNQEVIKEFYSKDFEKNREIYFPYENTAFFMDSNLIPKNDKDVYRTNHKTQETEYYSSFGTKIKFKNLSFFKRYEIRKYKDGALTSIEKFYANSLREVLLYNDSSINQIDFLKKNNLSVTVQFINTYSLFTKIYTYFNYTFSKMEKLTFDKNKNVVASETYRDIQENIPQYSETKKYFYENDRDLKVEIEYDSVGVPSKYYYYQKEYTSSFSQKIMLHHQILKEYHNLIFNDLDWYKSAKQ